MEKSTKKSKKSVKVIYIQGLEFARSSKARIKYLVLEILKQKPLLSEKELIKELYNRDKWIKEYLDKDPRKTTYIRYVIWEMSRKNEIIKVKIIGDLRRSYYLLPSQVPAFRDRIIKMPKNIEKLIEKQLKVEQARKEELSEEEDWEDEEELEELKKEAEDEEWDEEDWDEE